MTRPLALVTGASSGIGAAFARALAARGHDLVLVARRAEPMQALLAELPAVKGEVIALDLGEPGAAARLAAEVANRGLQVDVLVNNAGFGLGGDFADADLARLSAMIQLNVVALTELAHAFVGPMRVRKRGTLINVGSVVAFQAVPHFAAYAASKAYVLTLSEALAEELRPDGIRVQALCPGSTRTSFFDVAGVPAEDARMLSPEEVVKLSLEGLDRGREVVVTGLRNRLFAHGGRLLTRKAVTRIAGQLMAGE
jgi:short-subunit dehydrogenase